MELKIFDTNLGICSVQEDSKGEMEQTLKHTAVYEESKDLIVFDANYELANQLMDFAKEYLESSDNVRNTVKSEMVQARSLWTEFTTFLDRVIRIRRARATVR